MDELSTARELLAAVLLVVQLAGAVVVATVVTRRLAGPDRLVRALVWIVLVVAQGVAVPLALAAVALLSLPAVVIVHVAAAGAAIAWSRRRPPTEPEPWPAIESSWERVLVVGAAVIAVAFVVVTAYLSLRPGPSLDFDTREYHISNLAHWVQSGSLWSLPYSPPGSITSTHPGNGEMFGVWLGLPSHGDELVYAMPAVFAFVAIAAGAVAAREIAARTLTAAALGAIGVVAILTAPVYFFSQIDSLSTDITASACLLAAFALLLVARREGGAPIVALAGIALGLGLGSKYTAFLPTAALTLGALVLLRQKRLWWWLVPGVAALAAPWFLRNALATGNPLFPLALGPLASSESPVNFLNTPMLRHIADGETDILRDWFRLARTLVGPVLLLVAIGPLWALARRRPDRNVALIGVGVAAVAVLAYLATPYSGGGPTGLTFMLASCFRYGLFAAMIGIVLAAGVVPSRLFAALAAGTLAWNLWKITGRPGLARPDMFLSRRNAAGAIALALVVTGLVAFIARRRSTTIDRRPVQLGALAVAALVTTTGLFGVLHRIDGKQNRTLVENILLSLGPSRPAVVIGVANLRSVLGPRLDRPLVGVSRGGPADEIPFADAAQIRRRTLGDLSAPPPPASFATGLDRAIDATGRDVLVVGGISPLGYPDGWVPSARWCRVAGDASGTVYVTAALLPRGLQCVNVQPGASPVVGGAGSSRSTPGG